MGRVGITVLIIACLAWAAAVAYAGWIGWPHISLDLSHGDPATQAAHSRAVFLHVVGHAAVALAPLAVLGAISGLSRRRS